jgi:hypothetical protein
LRAIIVETFRHERRAGRRTPGRGADRQRARQHDERIWAHPRCARGRWTTVETPFGPGASLAAGRARRVGGAHGPGAGARRAPTRTLAELGYDRAAIARLHAEGAV